MVSPPKDFSTSNKFSCLQREQSPPFYNTPKNGGDLCAHRAGGASTYRFVCALHNPYSLSRPRPVNEATKPRATTKHGEEAPRLAVRTEK